MATVQYARAGEVQAEHGSFASGSARKGQAAIAKLWIFQDLCAVSLAFAVSKFAFAALHTTALPGLAGLGVPPERLVELGLLFFFSLVLLSFRLNLYRPDLSASYLHEQRLTVQASLMAGLIATGTLYLIHAWDVPRSLVLIAVALTTVSLCGRRLIQHSVAVSRRAAGTNRRNVLVVGSGPEAEAVHDHLRHLPHLGFAVTGSFPLPADSDPASEYLLEQIFAEARGKFVDEIFLVSPSQPGLAQKMLFWAREHEINLRIVPNLYDGLAWNRATEYVGQFPTFPLHRGEIPEVSLFLKHCLDLAVSAVALLICGIPMLIIALLIKLDSPGPVLYRSERVGRKGRIIQCTKFRTMVPDAERKLAELMHLNERDGVLFKISNDPRITRVGRFLRKYSLDELPQIFDVLRGDMSIVGPRPPIASEVRQYKLDHLRRLEVTPGMTGLWQVQARRDPSFDSYVSLDVAYIENWSLWLDLKIILRTVGVVLSGTGS